MEKPNLSQIIHSLKLSFRKCFGDITITSEISLLINETAKKVKQGFTAEWDNSNGVRVKLTKVRRWRAMPLTKPPYGGQSNPTVHKKK